MEDVKVARGLVEQRMRDTGFEDDIFDKILDLFERFDTDREKLFEEMLSKLEQPGYDGLRDRWATNCEQAEALLDRLEEDVRSLLSDSQANPMSPDERWDAVAPIDFLTGERRIWQQVAQLEVPDAATLISKVLEADIEIIKKCEEDLKNARSNDAIVQELLVKNFATATDKVKGLLAKYVQLPSAGVRLAAVFMRDPSAKEMASETIKALETMAAQNYEAARQKRAAKQVVLDNIDMLAKAREQLDEEWIEQVFARGAEAAGNWRGIGATGDYRATDWDWMKENVLDRGLDTRAEAAKEQSARLYDELYPTFIAESTKAFAQLTDDPDTLADFTDQLQTTFGSLNDLLANEQSFMSTVTGGAYAETAKTMIAFTIATLKNGWDGFRGKTKEADDVVKG